MTVKELIKKLCEYDLDLEVVITQEDGVRPVLEVDSGVYHKESGTFTEPEHWDDRMPPDANAVRIKG